MKLRVNMVVLVLFLEVVHLFHCWLGIASPPRTKRHTTEKPDGKSNTLGFRNDKSDVIKRGVDHQRFRVINSQTSSQSEQPACVSRVGNDELGGHRLYVAIFPHLH